MNWVLYLNRSSEMSREYFSCSGIVVKQPEVRKEEEGIVLTTHLTHFIYGYVALDVWYRTTQTAKQTNLLPSLHELHFPISSKGSFICIITYTG